MFNEAVESCIEYMTSAIRCDATDDFHIKRCARYMPDCISQVPYHACDPIFHVQYWLGAVSMNRHVHLACHYGYPQPRTRTVVMINDYFIRFTNTPAIALRVNPSGEEISVRAGSPLLLQRSPPELTSATPSSLASTQSGQQAVFARQEVGHGHSMAVSA